MKRDILVVWRACSSDRMVTSDSRLNFPSSQEGAFLLPESSEPKENSYDCQEEQIPRKFDEF